MPGTASAGQQTTCIVFFCSMCVCTWCSALLLPAEQHVCEAMCGVSCVAVAYAHRCARFGSVESCDDGVKTAHTLPPAVRCHRELWMRDPPDALNVRPRLWACCQCCYYAIAQGVCVCRQACYSMCSVSRDTAQSITPSSCTPVCELLHLTTRV